jgi:phenylalanyl-tRNA synthetase beta chain
MKLSYNWLKKFVDFNLSPHGLVELLISVGIESFVIPNNYDWHGVVTAKVLEVRRKCQGASKLFLCKVSDGFEEYSIVCGATNIAVGQIVPLAKVGAVLPGNFKIKKSRIRGLVSEGMVCSEFDLGLKEKSEGILVLAESTKVGVNLGNVLRKIDSIIEVEVPTNRGDCLSYLGISREIAAKLHKTQLLPTIKTFDVPKLNCIEVKSNLCSRYIGTIISGVKVAQSPKWILDVLEKSGIRSVNNIVDVANYVMIELGQPLHVFDMLKLSSKKVVVRNALNFEKIIILDGSKECELSSKMLVIADAKIPIAIAGIMGGKYSSIDKKTENVFLESAVFNTTSIRKTSKNLNLSSDSSYRFERGVSWDISDFASWRAANLIVEIAGGKIESREDLKTVEYKKINVSLRFEKVNKILGINIERNEILEILKSLGIILKEKMGMVVCAIPTWRNDIKEEIDLIEEIARIKGYDALFSSPKKYKNSFGVQNGSFLPSIVENMRTKLNVLGFSEVLNYSFSEIKELEKFKLRYFYKVANPISKENEVLRPSLLPSLYKSLLLNVLRGSESVALFEYGKVFNELGERKTFAVIMWGKVWKKWWKWSEKKIIPKYDFYFGGGVVRYILPLDEFSVVENLNLKNYYHPGKAASIAYNEKIVGQFGILKSLIIADHDKIIRGDIFYFELDLELIKNNFSDKFDVVYYKPYSKFPVLKRDISVVVDKSMRFSEIEKVIKNTMKTGKILMEYSMVSIYSNVHKLGTSKVSYSLELTYRSDDRTLTDEEVNKDMNLLLEELDRNLNVKLREVCLKR